MKVISTPNDENGVPKMTENEGDSHLKNDMFSASEEIDFSKVVIEPLYEDFVDFETFSKCDFRVVKVKNCEAVPKSKKAP